jgi:hypothetical protein
MTRPAVSSYQLKIQALLILYKLAHHGKAGGYERSWCLRFLLAFLYAHANGEDRSPFDEFWKAATRPQSAGEPDKAAASARARAMKREANRICLAVGEQPKAMQDQFWDELTREAYARRGEEARILK